MSPERQHGAIVVRRFELAPRHRFEPHTHPTHQLAWAARGVVTMGIGDAVWVLPRSRALWIPAGVPHDVVAGGSTTMMGVYLDPATCPVTWTEPTVVDASGVLGALLEHLADDLGPEQRARAEAVVHDLLRPLDVARIDVPIPTDPRAARVAAALRASPGDDRSLAEWGRLVGASGRTLARAIERETGMGFAQWRTRLRVAAALELLAAGATVSRVAHDVGYSTPSAFVAAFRRTVGTSPGAYYTSPRRRR